MQLQGRPLQIETQGEDVALLHRELIQLGFQPPREEVERLFFGPGTRKIILEFQSRYPNEELASGVVDQRTGELLNAEVDASQPRFIVEGRIRKTDDTPMAGLIVRAVDKDLRHEEELGTATTDQNGYYQITYAAAQFRRAEKGNADLVVRAYYSEPFATRPVFVLVASSPITFNAQSKETIDLTVGGELRGPSEYERYLKEITPLLQDTALADLREDEVEARETGKFQDVTFLAGEAGIDPEHIAFLIQAHRLQRKTELAAEVFYGFFREGLPTDLSALLAQSPDVQRRALVKAVEDNIIPLSFGAEVGTILERLKQLIASLALEEPAEKDAATLAQLIGTVLPEREHQAAFLSAYVNHSGPIAEFWQGLESMPEFKDRVADLQLTLQLGALVRNHLPLVRELQRMKQAGDIQGLSDLARLDENDWHEIIIRPREGGLIAVPPDVPGKDTEEKTRNYARAMAHMVEDAFPTAFATHRLEKDDLPERVNLHTFFKANPGFNPRTTRLEGYLKEHPGAWEGFAETDREETKINLKAMTRLYRLAPRYSQVSTLMKDGLDSAHGIAGMGRNVFLARHGEALGGKRPARMVYEKALQVRATAMTLFMDHAPTVGRAPMHAVPDEAALEVEGVPEWSTLFGSIDLCACEHCRSVYSPAAYLVDVLHFLKDRRIVDTVTRDANGQVINVTFRKKPGTTVDMSAKDVLFARRPDLGQIELTCENTNTPLPYVDLVNEALENAVAPPPLFAPFNLSTGLEGDLNSRTLSPALKAAFSPSLSNQALITVGGQGKPWTLDEPWWTIDKPGYTYTVRKTGGQLRVVSRGLQTKGPAAERAANPQYANAAAYDLLRQRVHPWSLPFDLWWEEARTYLGHLGVPRYRIMEAFLPGERSDLLNDVAVAREYLGLTSVEARIITGVTASQPGAAAPGLWNLWGFDTAVLSGQNSIPDPSDSTERIAAGNWLDVLPRLDVFLQQSGLCYGELLDLLDTHYVNPVAGSARTIQIVGPANGPATCETSKLRLQGLDEPAAHRIVRFTRLWRALGWTMRELDLALLAFGSSHSGEDRIRPAAIDDVLLVRLSHIQCLKEAFNRPVHRLLAWWISNLGEENHRRQWWTTTYIDRESEDQRQAPSFYASLFRNRAVINPLDPDFPEDPIGLTGKLSAQVATITAALGISAADVDLLLGNANVIPTILDPADPEPDPAKKRRIPDDRLSLDYLSYLYRHAGLARALKLPVRDYVKALELIDTNPFASTTDTLLFVEQVGSVRGSGFTFTELDYLLRHRTVPQSPIAPTEEAIAVVLDEMRSGLQKIAVDNTFSADAADPAGITTDPNGDLTRRKLALLNWSSALIDQVVATLNGAVVYEALLDPLPPGIDLPNDTGIRYDADTKRLVFTGPMTDVRKAHLDAVPNSNAAYLSAVRGLYDAPRKFIARHMRTFSVPDFTEKLGGLPAGLQFPKALKGKIYFDTAADPATLHFVGAMTEQERDLLLDLSTDPTDSNHVPYQAAVNALFAQPDSLVPAPNDAFLSASGLGNDAAAMFDSATAPEDRFLRLLKKLLPYLRRTLSERLVVERIAEALKLEARIAETILVRGVVSPANPRRRALDEFLDPAFAESDPQVKPSARAFPAQFSTFTLLHKVAMVVTKFGFTHRQVMWLFTHGPKAGWLDLNTLPIDATKPAAPFDRWLRLADLARLRDGLPQGENALEELFAHVGSVSPASPAAEKNAAKQAWVAALVRWTQWPESDLETLLGKAGDHADTGQLAAVFPADYVGERLLARLRDCFLLLKRLGMPAELGRTLADREVFDPLNADPAVAPDTARKVQQAVRAKYDEAQWLNLAKPLRDVLREKQRAALVAYLITYAKLSHNVRDANDLYAHFLIDAEMDPCIMISRIKQAISSTQLFVQRCLMNLESEVTAGAEVDEHWRQWKWMKNYRVWKANRKVFLYPENWIEPELRDDKSPFFKALESELLQSDLTLETAETAFLHYLEKLDQVARLEIVGMYHQVEQDLSGHTAVDILHVFGRTYGTPRNYYYRQRVNKSYWTAWDRVDLDIEGDHLIPVVWNRRLYLFWPIFTEKAKPLAPSLKGGNLSGSDPVKYWEIKLAWSERKLGKWMNKRVSVDHFDGFAKTKVFSTENLDAFLFRSVVDNLNNLSIVILHPLHLELAPVFLTFRFDGCHSDPVISSISRQEIVEQITDTEIFRMFLKERGESTLSLPAPTDAEALALTPGTFHLLPPNDGSSIARHPFFYLDNARTFFVIPTPVQRRISDWVNVVALDPGIVHDIGNIYHAELKPLPFDRLGPISNPRDPMLFEPSFPARPDLAAVREGTFRSGVARASRITAPAEGLASPALALVSPVAVTGTMARVAIAGVRNRAVFNLLREDLITSPVVKFRPRNGYFFQMHYHPYVCAFVRELNRDGVDGLLQRKVQTEPWLFLPRAPGGLRRSH